MAGKSVYQMTKTSEGCGKEEVEEGVLFPCSYDNIYEVRLSTLRHNVLDFVTLIRKV